MVQAENFNTIQINFSISRVKHKETKHATHNKTISLFSQEQNKLIVVFVNFLLLIQLSSQNYLSCF
jgi:hypothetical protein